MRCNSLPPPAVLQSWTAARHAGVARNLITMPDEYVICYVIRMHLLLQSWTAARHAGVARNRITMPEAYARGICNMYASVVGVSAGHVNVNVKAGGLLSHLRPG